MRFVFLLTMTFISMIIFGCVQDIKYKNISIPFGNLSIVEGTGANAILNHQGDCLIQSTSHNEVFVVKIDTQEIISSKKFGGKICPILSSHPSKPVVLLVCEQEMVFWDYKNNTVDKLFVGDHTVRSLGFSSDGTRCFVAFYRGLSDPTETIIVIDSLSRATIAEFGGTESRALYSAAMSSDGKVIAANFGTEIILWNIDSKNEIVRQNLVRPSDALAFVLADTKIVSTLVPDEQGKSITFWDTKTLDKFAEYNPHSMAVQFIAPTRNGQAALLGSQDRYGSLIDCRSGKVLFSKKLDNYVGVSISGNNKFGLMCGHKNAVIFEMPPQYQ